MPRFLAPLAALLLTLAFPAQGQDGPALDPAIPAQPGAVALYLQARTLAELGTNSQDPLLVLTAARILHGLNLVDTPRQSDPAIPPEPVTAPGATELLGLARLIDAGGIHADLIDQIAREVPPHPRTLRATAATLPPGQVQTWTLTLFGGVPVELAVLAQGLRGPSVQIGPAETPICLSRGTAPTHFCSFALAKNGEVTVIVTNHTESVLRYLLLTE